MIENIMKCPECGLCFEGFEGYTCPHCGKPNPQKMAVGGHMHTGLKGRMYMHDPKIKHGCTIIAAWSKRYTDLIGGKEIDEYIILTMENRKITRYTDCWGHEYTGSPETNPCFGKWDSDWCSYLKQGEKESMGV